MCITYEYFVILAIYLQGGERRLAGEKLPCRSSPTPCTANVYSPGAKK